MMGPSPGRLKQIEADCREMQYRCLTLAAELKQGNTESCPVIATEFDEVADKMSKICDWALRQRIIGEQSSKRQ